MPLHQGIYGYTGATPADPKRHPGDIRSLNRRATTKQAPPPRPTIGTSHTRSAVSTHPLLRARPAEARRNLSLHNPEIRARLRRAAG